MVKAINNEATNNSYKRFKIVFQDMEKLYCDIDIDNYSSLQKKRFYERFSISIEFWMKDPGVWMKDPGVWEK